VSCRRFPAGCHESRGGVRDPEARRDGTWCPVARARWEPGIVRAGWRPAGVVSQAFERERARIRALQAAVWGRRGLLIRTGSYAIAIDGSVVETIDLGYGNHRRKDPLSSPLLLRLQAASQLIPSNGVMSRCLSPTTRPRLLLHRFATESLLLLPRPVPRPRCRGRCRACCRCPLWLPQSPSPLLRRLAMR